MPFYSAFCNINKFFAIDIAVILLYIVAALLYLRRLKMPFIEVSVEEADRWRCPFCGKNNPIAKRICNRPRSKQLGGNPCGYNLDYHANVTFYEKPRFLKMTQTSGDAWYKDCSWYKPHMSQPWRSSNRGK